MPTSAEILFDTSAAIALVSAAHPLHDAVRDASRGLVRGLAGHAIVETYSVLTRLPGTSRLSPAGARTVIERAFPASVALDVAASLNAVTLLTDAGIAGGAVYDGLVGLAAQAAGLPLLSCDIRAAKTYSALRVEVRLL